MANNTPNQDDLHVMSPEQLVDAIDNKSSLIIIDARPYSDYVVSHIVGAFSLRLSGLLLRRLARNKIAFEGILMDDQKEKFQAMSSVADVVVVVYGEDDSEVDNPASTVRVVVKALKQKLTNVKLLQGGFNAFLQLDSHSQYVEAAADVESPPADCFTSNPIERAPGTPVDRHTRDPAPSKIYPYLFVGAEAHAENPEILRELGITHILSLTTRPIQHADEKIQYKTIALRDCWDQGLLSRFTAAFDFIDEARKAGGRVLVHCVAGISRSPTFTIAYIMREHRMSVAEAYAMVKAKRHAIAPNLDFIYELQAYETQLGIAPSQMVHPPSPLVGINRA